MPSPIAGVRLSFVSGERSCEAPAARPGEMPCGSTRQQHCFNHERHEGHERTAKPPFFYFVTFVSFVVQVFVRALTTKIKKDMKERQTLGFSISCPSCSSWFTPFFLL